MDKLEQQNNPPPVDAKRRRLAQAGLAVPVVLATLASKNALATAPYNCTISGKLSGNTSSHGAPVSCKIGKSHGYWKNHPNDWVYGFTQTALFTSRGFSNQYPNKTLLDVLNLGGGAGAPPYEALGREAVCAYMNAFKYGTDFPLTPTQVVTIFNTTVSAGQYIPVLGATPWTPEDVKNYFESLHD